ncbi:MAG TPA: hypothetical protein VMY39_02545, partial [Planctomycetota bacterium]|nr:hypothetical protein [Planctomycetota bacterium]
GTHLGVIVDPEGKLAERERGNNAAWVTLVDAERRAPPGDAAIPPDPLVFVSFEPDCGELRDLETVNLAGATETPEHATHGRRAARLTFPAKTTSALRVVYDGEVPMPKRWDAYSLLRLDVFNASPRATSLVVRLRSLTEVGTVRYDTAFELPPGKPVTLEVPLIRLNRVDLAAVEELDLVVDGPDAPVTLFVDNLRLLKADRPAKLALVRGAGGEIARESFPAARAVDASPVTLTRDDDLAHFPGVRDVVIADGFDSPTSKRGARFDIRRDRSMGMTLELARDDAPWPADWSKYRRLSFQAKRDSKEPFAVSLKLRSSHPARGVKYVGRSFALRADGATHFIDLDEIRDRLDLDHMSRVTWFVWRPQFDGTLWLGELRLEK